MLKKDYILVLMVSDLLCDVRPGRHLSSLWLFLSERDKSSYPLHLKSSSDERECVRIGPIAQCVQWVLPDVKLCSSCFTTAKVAVTRGSQAQGLPFACGLK